MMLWFLLRDALLPFTMLILTFVHSLLEPKAIQIKLIFDMMLLLHIQELHLHNLADILLAYEAVKA